ncbi:ATP-grasp domain-containing protein [Actinoalloteichus caeruleus]|uniref:ATP-grasp domain-containing protein n=1 Tax=Actinoalloteichus cyanogriseus TaxID=2893586 RepID=UPI003AACD145
MLLLEAAGPESGALVETTVARGYEVHAVTGSDQLASYSTTLRTALSGCLPTDLSRPEHAIEDILRYARRVGADAVLTTNEYLTPLAAQVCAALELPGNDPALARAARSKAAMAEQFARCGVTTPHTRVLSHELELCRLVASGHLTFPCVLKPAEGAGSVGVRIVTSAEEAAAAFRAAQKGRGMYGMVLDPRVVIQELIEGVEYSVESITQSGRTTHLCVTRKMATRGARRVELGHGLPAVLPAELERAVYKQVDLAIAAVGIRNGASHTEVMLTPDTQCAVIEIGARIGAGYIGFLIRHALGIDPWAACLDTALGRPAHLSPTRADYATVRFLTAPHPGRLVAVAGLPDHGPQVPLVRLRRALGETVTGTVDNTGRLGSFVVVGPDRQRVDLDADHLLAQVQIHIEPFDPSSPAVDHCGSP